MVQEINSDEIFFKLDEIFTVAKNIEMCLTYWLTLSSTKSAGDECSAY